MSYIGQQDISVHAIDKSNPHEVTKAQVGLTNVEDLLNNVTTTDPLVTSDLNAGYSIKSRWINTATDKEYVCTDSTNGAAVWVETTSTGGASTWGTITGTLSTQTDLQSALNAKANSVHTHVEADITDLDKNTVAEVDAKVATKENTFVKNTAFNKNFGTALNTVTQGNDSRLSDARTPTIHTHTKSDITDFVETDYATGAEGDLATSALQDITAEPLTDLVDIPTIVGNAGKLLKVNATANGYLWGDPAGTTVSWGDIAGTLSAQTDLQNALNAKAALVHTHLEADITDLQAYLLNISGSPLSELSDVTITANTTGEILKWNGTAWINNTLSEAGIATSAQGTLADSATQPGDNVSTLTNDSGFISSFTETDPVFIAQKGAANGVPTLGADSKIPSSQLPAIAITDTFVVVSEAAMLALTAQTGDVAVRSDENKTYILQGSNPALLADWQIMLTPTDSVLSVNGNTGSVVLSTTDISEGTNEYYTEAKVSANTNVASNTSHAINTANPHSVTKTQVGLSNVDNTTDLNKPVSTATQTALDLKSDTGHNHVKADITDFSIVDADVAANAAISSEKLKCATLNGAQYSTVQDLQDIFHSAGYVSGGAITDNANGTITVALGSGIIRAVNTSVDTLYFFDWIANPSLTLTDNSLNWIYVNYNAGNPIITTSVTKPAEEQTNVMLAVVHRSGTTLHISETEKHTVGDHAGLMIQRTKDTMPYANASGARISETGTRNLAISIGKFWEGLQEFTTLAKDTSVADSFVCIHRDGAGGFTEIPATTQIDNLLYDDGTGTLATLPNNAYGVHWIYQSVTSELYAVFGQDSYTLTGAQDSMAPMTLPDYFERHCGLMGRIIIQKSATTFTDIESAFMTMLSGSVVTDHGDLVGLLDDDHSQYHTDARGDARYYTQSQLDISLGNKSDTSHVHDTSDITTGTLADARIAESNVTQHQAVLSVTESQISDLQTYQVAQTNTVSTTDATVTVIGTIAIPVATSLMFTIQGTGRNTSNGDVLSIRLDGSIKNILGTTTMVGAINTIEFNDAGAAAWVIQATANDTSDNLEISVTGGVGLNINWKTITTSIGV